MKYTRRRSLVRSFVLAIALSSDDSHFETRWQLFLRGLERKIGGKVTRRMLLYVATFSSFFFLPRPKKAIRLPPV